MKKREYDRVSCLKNKEHLLALSAKEKAKTRAIEIKVEIEAGSLIAVNMLKSSELFIYINYLHLCYVNLKKKKIKLFVVYHSKNSQMLLTKLTR